MRKFTFMKTIIDRVNAPETKIGKFLVRITGYVVLIISGVGAFLECVTVIPHDWISQDIKTAIVVCSLLSVVIGKLTKDPRYEKPTTPAP